MKYKLKITRFLQGDDWTIGEFHLMDISSGLPVLNGFCLEPAGEDEIRSGLDRRVPEGFYKAEFEFSPKFKRNLPVIYNEKVSKSRRILIHAGNTGEDTAGCILLGDEWQAGKVFNSKYTLEKVLLRLKNEPFIVDIFNGFNK